MNRQLQHLRQGPEQAKNMVVFLHGYGANGQDLIGLADPLAEHMPETVFIAPNAPETIPGMPFGRQWFPIPWIDGSSEEQARAGLLQSAEDLNAFLDQVMTDEGLAAENVILFGFSQGTMLSLHIAPRRDQAVAGVVAFSGRLLVPELLQAETRVKPPVVLIHGDQDDVVPVQSLNEAGQALNDAGFQVYAHIMQGTAHGIAPDGLSVALSFMRDKLELE